MPPVRPQAPPGKQVVGRWRRNTKIDPTATLKYQQERNAMSRWARLFRRRKRMMDDLDQDIRDHIERETQDNIERGMPPEEARYAALRKFGNVTR